MMEMDGMAGDITWYEKFLGDMLWLTLSEGHTWIPIDTLDS